MTRAGRWASRSWLTTPLVAVALLGAVPAQTQTTAPAQRGILVAYSLTDGKQIWTSTTSPVFGIGDVSDSILVGRAMACDTNKLRYVARSTSDGHAQWSAPTDIDALPIRGDETVTTGANRSGIVVVSVAHELRGLDVRTGDERWKHRFSQTPSVRVNATLAVVTGTKATSAAGTAGVVSAYDRRTGKRLWSITRIDSESVLAFPGSDHVVASFKGSDGTTASSVVVDARNGRELWRSPLTTLGTSGGVVLLATTRSDADPHSEGRDVRTGALLWRAQPMYYAVPLGREAAVVTADEQSIVIEARTGHTMYALPIHVGVLPSNRDSFAWAIEDQVHLVDSATGQDRWVADLPRGDNPTSVAIGERAVYVSIGCTPND